MKKLILLLSVLSIFLLGCEKEEEVKKSSSLPSMTDPNDVCSSMNDLNFMRYCYDNFDVNNDGRVSIAEANAATAIEVPNMEIKSLTGIQYFSNLIKLDFSNNNVTEIDLSKNIKLKGLRCSGNNLISLNISNNLELKSLAFCLTKTNLSENKKLVFVQCIYSKYTSYPKDDLIIFCKSFPYNVEYNGTACIYHTNSDYNKEDEIDICSLIYKKGWICTNIPGGDPAFDPYNTL
ncbi:MAG: hypothetical protein LBR75_02120 [Prevotellaceae bacterium]|jgi:hypothetical protein|nr:hypothetical protein [Prevotellaceae bacterium]